jgi:hypothetical protein
MIVRSEMMPALLEACPSFAPQYSKFCAEWQNNPSKPDYLALAELARHIAERFDRNEMQEIPTLFTAVERLLLEGEPYVSEALTVGLLENLQNSNIYPTEIGTLSLSFLALKPPTGGAECMIFGIKALSLRTTANQFDRLKNNLNASLEGNQDHDA